MVGAKVNVVSGWGDDFARDVNAQVRDAVADASRVAAATAATVASARRRSGKMANVRPVEVRGTPDGWEGGFRSDAALNQGFYSGFQSRGTLGARRRKLKASTVARRSSPSGQARLAKLGGSGGIRPLGHEEKGLAAGKKHLIARLNQLG